MIGAELIEFAALLLLVGALFRVIETKWPDTPVGKALAFIY